MCGHLADKKNELRYAGVLRCAHHLEVLQNNFLYLAEIVKTSCRQESQYPEVFPCADRLEVFKNHFLYLEAMKRTSSRHEN